MGTVIETRGTKKLPLVDIEAELKRFEHGERTRLGLDPDNDQWIETMAHASFTRDQRTKTTILVGGLTMAHDYFIDGALAGLGYQLQVLECPTNAALQVGKEFGNRGQCNPTYFTVGNLVKYLITLRDKHGMSAKEVVDKYVYLTAGACGPCRFGMYVTEYRKALRDAGFDGFRVMLFQQTGGFQQATGAELGLEMNPAFFLALTKAILAGDVINALGYRLRPYEKNAGDTDKAIDGAKKLCHAALRTRTSILAALWKSKALFEAVKVDRTQPKPKVSVIGEFWAMTTEGDGNYQLQRFLESEGAECDIQIVTSWLLYMLWESKRDTGERMTLRASDTSYYGLGSLGTWGVGKRLATVTIAEKLTRIAFQVFANAGGLYGYHLPDMNHVAAIAHEHYNNDLRGGEGHMEVGKLILNVVEAKAHMTLSVKPFGCMPSAGVSDGVQSAITEKFPGTIFCPVETSGDGRVNFYSRVQMYLFKAKQAAIAEYQRALADGGVTREQVGAFLEASSKYGSGLHKSPHRYAGNCADLVAEVAPLMTKSRWLRARERLVALGHRSVVAAQRSPERVMRVVGDARSAAPELVARVREDVSIFVDQRAAARNAVAGAPIAIAASA